MDALDATLRIHESADPAAAFGAMAEALKDRIGLRCVLRVSAAGGEIRNRWPADAEVTPELLDAALHVLHPEIFPVGSELPVDASNFPGSEMLLLPLRRYEEDAATVVLIAPEGSFGEELEPWERIARGLEQIEARHRRVCRAEAECQELRQRAEESEALHTLGLAANRTLDPDEVLNLVARFTRTLLGAHYVTVNTSEDGHGRIRMVAAVGLRDADAAKEDYLFARRVVETEKPLTAGKEDAAFAVEEFPFHAREGMQVGLGIPLSLYGDTFGTLIVGYRRPYTITPRDVRLALTLAGHAAVAISNARLHRAVEDRSRDLERAYEELARLTKAKERFYNAISHDLRTPVGAVKGYADLLLQGATGELPPKARRYIENTRRASETLLALVNDLLDFAKLEAGKMEVVVRPCALADIVQDALSAVQPQADAKGLRIDIPVLDTLPSLQTDPKRLRQILVNLLSNAVKFTDQGEIGIEVREMDGGGVAPNGGIPTEKEISPAQIEVRVSDTGRGIPAGDIDRVFEEFEQIPGSDGTGLGLPISRKLAQLLGGELRAESEIGAGSTFVLQIPRRLAAGVQSMSGAAATLLTDAV